MIGTALEPGKFHIAAIDNRANPFAISNYNSAINGALGIHNHSPATTVHDANGNPPVGRLPPTAQRDRREL